MLLALQSLLGDRDVAELRRIASTGEFVDGAVSSPGLAAAGVKRNEQLSLTSTHQRRVEQIVLNALDRNETFRTAAIPKLIRPPILSRYRPGMAYGMHIDNPVMRKPVPMRLDLSITLFLSDPESYSGGELCIETPYGEKRIKLPAGDAVLYPTTMLHRVEEITSGERLAAVTWIQSMVHDQDKRSMLYDLALVTQWIHAMAPQSPFYHRLNNTRANLARMWAID
ncbi:MAG: Fe2+-dependent dioxygenase [Rhodospirillales bacterium]|nr:Fe2+-dependent dioxygenase [Rhodospirillales bacterium]